ncbi:hypothetical protein ACIQGW_19305 [Lysinibacillus xylanilyticus]|uniref:hypothetical protein n=1 Tax=Lysinibacillus xylanilyticus TaxID=582475 RepID=UPI00381A8018
MPKTYSVHDGEPKTTLADLRKVLSVPSTVNPDGLAPFTVIGANKAYALLFEDIVKYGNPNSTVREQNEATLALLSSFGKAGKVKKGMEALKDMEKGLEAAHDLANNANKVEKTHHTQKEIQEVGEYSKKLLDKGTGNIGNQTRDQTRHTTQNQLKNGEVSMSNLESMIPSNIPNTFKPTDTITDGAKYEFTLADGQKAIIRWHSPDPVAASKYPGSASGSRWTTQIKIGNKQLKSDGTWTKNQSLNEVHIPIEGK